MDISRLMLKQQMWHGSNLTLALVSPLVSLCLFLQWPVATSYWPLKEAARGIFSISSSALRKQQQFVTLNRKFSQFELWASVTSDLTRIDVSSSWKKKKIQALLVVSDRNSEDSYRAASFVVHLGLII